MPTVQSIAPRGVAIAALLLTVLGGCGRSAPTGPPPPEVLVVEVAKRDVPVVSEWLGTTEGFVDAEVRAQVTGYLISRDYQDEKNQQVLLLIDTVPPAMYKPPPYPLPAWPP